MADEAPSPEGLQVEVLPTNPDSDVQQMKAEAIDTGYIPLQDFMGITHPDNEQKDKMQFIWNEVGKGRDRAETLQAIKDIRYRLSPPDVGENYLHKLYSYVRLMKESRSIEKEKKAYEGVDNLADS